MGIDKKIFEEVIHFSILLYWLACIPNAGIINFKMLVESIMGMIIMHLVFSDNNISPHLWRQRDGGAMNFTIKIPHAI